MPKYVVHVGPSKTGTTYLQGSLYHTRDALMERGIAYLPNWWLDKPAYNHEFLAEKLRRGDDPLLERKFAELNDSSLRLVVMSFEGFPQLSRPELERFRTLLAGNEVSIVFYFRRWSDRLPSAWQQVVRGGGTSGFPEFLTRLMINSHRSLALNPGALLDKFADIFGKQSVQLVSYNNVLQRKQDLFRHFCRAILSEEFTGELPPAKKNESFDIFETEIFRILNVFDSLQPERFSGSLMQRFFNLSKSVDLDEVRAMMRDYVSDLRVSDHAPMFTGLYDELMGRYMENMVDPDETLGLFRRSTRVVQYVRPDYLLSGGAGETLRAMHEKALHVA